MGDGSRRSCITSAEAGGLLRAGRLLPPQPLRLGWWDAPCISSSVYSVRMVNDQLVNSAENTRGYPAYTNPLCS